MHFPLISSHHNNSHRQHFCLNWIHSKKRLYTFLLYFYLFICVYYKKYRLSQQKIPITRAIIGLHIKQIVDVVMCVVLTDNKFYAIKMYWIPFFTKKNSFLPFLQCANLSPHRIRRTCLIYIFWHKSSCAIITFSTPDTICDGNTIRLPIILLLY